MSILFYVFLCILVVILIMVIHNFKEKIAEKIKSFSQSAWLDISSIIFTTAFTIISRTMSNWSEISYIALAFTLSFWIVMRIASLTSTIKDEQKQTNDRFSIEVSLLKNISKNIDYLHAELNQNIRKSIKIAIFDRLVIYIPVFLADTQSYFKQEGLSVEFVPLGNDSLVVNAVKNGDADIGICDPTVAMEILEPKDFKIIMPICLGAFASMWTISKANLENKIIQKSLIKIATYPKPSTSYVLAHKYKKILEEEHNYDPDLIQLEEITYNDEIFKSIQALLNSFTQFDLILLWEPFSEILKHKGASKVEKWEDFEIKKNNFINTSTAKPSENLIMYSAIIGLITNKADEMLASKVYKAVSRATMAIHSKMGEEDYRRTFIKHIRRAGNWVTSELGDNSIHNLYQEVTRNDVTPYIDFDHKEPWGHQLYNNVHLRFNVEGDPTSKLETIKTKDQCESFFFKSSIT